MTISTGAIFHTEKRDSVFASDNPEDLTLLPVPPFKPLGSHVIFLTQAEHAELNPPDGPISFMLGSDTQLFRRDPRKVSEVLANWTEYAAPKDKTQLELNCEEFKAQLSEYLGMYDKRLASGDLDGAAQLKNDLVIMISSAQASGQTSTDPELRQTVDEIMYALAA